MNIHQTARAALGFYRFGIGSRVLTILLLLVLGAQASDPATQLLTTSTPKSADASVEQLATVTPGDKPAGFYPPPYLRNRPMDFLQRARDSLQLAVTTPNPPLGGSRNPARAILYYGIAALALNQDTEHANEQIGQLRLITDVGDISDPDDDRVAHLSFSYALRLYMLYQAGSRYMPGRLTSAAQQHLEREFERTLNVLIRQTPKYAAYGAKYDAIPQTPDAVWPPASENIWMQRAHFKLLAWQALKNVPEYKDRLYDGHTPAEHYEKSRTFFSIYLDEIAKKGLFIEVGAGYEHYTVDPLYNLHDFSEDAVIRKKAEMVLDLWLASAGQRQIKYVQGGGKSRAKGSHRYKGTAGLWRGFYVWFGEPDPAEGGKVWRTFFEPTTSYEPPSASARIATDAPSWSTRGNYEYTERRLGVKSGLRATGGLDLERTILHYGFVTPSYVMGAALLDPDPKVSTYFTSQMGRWLGVIFNGDPDSRIFPDVLQKINTTGKENSLDSDNFYAVQDRNVMIAQKSWRFTSAYNRLSTINTRVYFSPTLDAVQEDNCWIFARDGGAYAAVKVVNGEDACGYSWLRPWEHAVQATPKNHNYAHVTDPEGMSPIILIAAEAKDYSGDFGKFKAAVKAQPIRYRDDQISFSTLTLPLARKDSSGKYRNPPSIGTRNGIPIATSPAQVYDSPFIRSDWNSGLIYIRKNNDTEILDFRDPNNPVKNVGSPVTSAFPPGVGSVQPIVFKTSDATVPAEPSRFSPRASPLRRRRRGTRGSRWTCKHLRRRTHVALACEHRE